MMRIARDEVAVHLLGFRETSLSGQRRREVETRLNQGGIERERAAVRRFRLDKARQLGQRNAELALKARVKRT